MNSAVIRATPQKAGASIKIPDYSARAWHGNISVSQFANWAGPRTLKLWRIKRPPVAFFRARRSSMAAGAGSRTAGRSHSPVFATRTCPPPKPRTEVADSTTAMESNMNTANMGAIRPILPPQSVRNESALAIAKAAVGLLCEVCQGRTECDAHTLKIIAVGLRSAGDLIEGGRGHE